MSEGGAMTLEFTCELDGYVMRGQSDDELVAQVERHIAEAHTNHVGELSRDQILGMVRRQVGAEE
jgi:predicted small metal-binding protein